VEEKSLDFGVESPGFTVSAQFMPFWLFWHLPKFGTFYQEVFFDFLLKLQA
jgi:hypothetical protein